MDATGNTTNPTKSPCDPYVFNTVLTRSKSLVVVVGSPLALLGIEKHMVKLYGSEGKCWSHYLRHCLEKNTFIIPSSVQPDKKVREEYMLILKAALSDEKVVSRVSQMLNSAASQSASASSSKKRKEASNNSAALKTTGMCV